MNNPLDYTQKRTVLIVNSASDALVALNDLLKPHVDIKLATSAEKALLAARYDANAIDLILIDISAPEMDGLDCCRQLKQDGTTQHLPILLIADAAAPADIDASLRHGAADYLARPLHLPLLLARIETLVELSHARIFLHSQDEYLKHLVKERTRDLVAMQDATLRAMAALTQLGTGQQGAPLQRRQHYLAALAWQLHEHPRLAAELGEEKIELLFKAMALYDIGMIGVPAQILNKPETLSASEMSEIHQHVARGRELILAMARQVDTPSPLLLSAEDMAWGHHERWDGSGYPQGLAGEAIPLPARLVAIVDVYDALTSDRPWRPAHTHEAAREIIGSLRGSGFDPDIVDALLGIGDKLEQIAKHYPD
ncbi:putative two-component system response regulator [Andreprevotia lacus DSM 23236]|jgi:putative two-component system response regulator|uniref:Putative two-component system response regulator n=1 Tax=Andreprevotia lacus DSM 23236 TaxID=1121001 RepID=A0A1W1XIQ5_9NEIS|nr:HD domain-containing phosphohydrolase [Andreprevotia lacus]SMC23855.1 putative two-component system response regulator [Andreprevotia lacus DSM 23236]